MSSSTMLNNYSRLWRHHHRLVRTLLSTSSPRSLSSSLSLHSSSSRQLSSASSGGSENDGGANASNNNDKDKQKGKRVWTKDDIAEAAAERQRHERAVQEAKWVSSWMTPWERAQMDTPTRPLNLWERLYWRVFIVLGGVGFAYETWVLGNRRVLLGDMKAQQQYIHQNSSATQTTTEYVLVDTAKDVSASSTRAHF